MRQSTLIIFTLCSLLITVSFAVATVWLDTPTANDRVYAEQLSLQAEQPGQQVESLPTVGSYKKLKQLLGEMQRSNIYGRGEIAVSGSEESGAAAPTAAPTVRKEMAQDVQQDASSTNIQVAGVDEADVVKTDGTYLYQALDQQVVIALLHPVEEMKVVSKLRYDDNSFYPQELYVDDNFLVVIGQSIRNQSPNRFQEEMVKAIVYDITDRTNPKQVREVELEGHYVSSRKIDSALYLVSNKYIDYYHIMNEKSEYPAPVYFDTAYQKEAVTIDYKEIYYFPQFNEPTYLFVAGLDLSQPDQPLDVSSYLGATENIYASTQHLYIAATQYDQPEPATKKMSLLPERAIAPHTPVKRDTTIFKFALDSGKTEYLGKGEVPGTILNQFSMDEHDGYFRIATTTGEVWRNDEHTSKNHLYVLDSKLKLSGKIEDIAPGERIYSVRFVGDRAYMVTFKNTDPLFVIDLKQPTNPKILGALKIPGYSDYLHPYDENHIIGFGKDTIEVSNKTLGGQNGSTAFYQGIKIAMFDVSDVSNPVEKHKIMIGDRGTDSELLHNHKALLFSKEKQLMAFPVTLYEIPDKQNSGYVGGDATRHGDFSFQGAYVYNVSLDEGFTLKKRITHLSEEDYRKAGTGWYDNMKNVQRIIYIKDTLYTLSQSQIKAHDIATFNQKGSLTLPSK